MRVNTGRQQVSLQENRVNDRKEMAGDMAVELMCIGEAVFGKLLSTLDLNYRDRKQHDGDTEKKDSRGCEGEEEEDSGSNPLNASFFFFLHK